MKTIIGIPTYDGKIGTCTLRAVHSALLDGAEHYFECQGSILTRTFNMLWAAALNSRKIGMTHFCLLHADIELEDGWFPKMMKIMEEKKADVLSVVVPIKTNEGLTSTAIDMNDGFAPRRLTLKECLSEAPTFTDKDLLVNTGVMLVDFRHQWVEEMCFRFEDAITKNSEGLFVAQGMSEDWLFSRDAKAMGASIWATTEIKVNHLGGGVFSNDPR